MIDLTEPWRTNRAGIRAQILQRDLYTCCYCGRRCLTASGHKKKNPKYRPSLDHVVPVSQGGRTTPANLLTACRECNTRKANKPLLIFLMEMLCTK